MASRLAARAAINLNLVPQEASRAADAHRHQRKDGPEFVFDRATRLRVRGGQPVIDLASGAQVRSDVVILSVGVEYVGCLCPGWTS